MQQHGASPTEIHKNANKFGVCFEIFAKDFRTISSLDDVAQPNLLYQQGLCFGSKYGTPTFRLRFESTFLNHHRSNSRPGKPVAPKWTLEATLRRPVPGRMWCNFRSICYCKSLTSLNINLSPADFPERVQISTVTRETRLCDNTAGDVESDASNGSQAAVFQAHTSTFHGTGWSPKILQSRYGRACLCNLPGASLRFRLFNLKLLIKQIWLLPL